MKLLGQIGQSPAHYPMVRRNRPAFDNIGQDLALGIAQSLTRVGHLTIQQSKRTTRVKPDYLIPDNLGPDAADPDSCA